MNKLFMGLVLHKNMRNSISHFSLSCPFKNEVPILYLLSIIYEEYVLSVFWLSPSEDPDKYSLRWCGSASEVPQPAELEGDKLDGLDRSLLDAVWPPSNLRPTLLLYIHPCLDRWNIQDGRRPKHPPVNPLTFLRFSKVITHSVLTAFDWHMTSYSSKWSTHQICQQLAVVPLVANFICCKINDRLCHCILCSHDVSLLVKSFSLSCVF